MKKLYAILPCYNEEQNIGNLLEEWEKQVEKLEENNFKLYIRVINDASTDNTKDVVLEKQKYYSNIKLIEHEENKGLCGGINTALNYFNKNAMSEDLLVIMDGDNTHDPKYIHSMINKLNSGNDCVIASRYQNGADVKGLATYREKLSDMAKVYYELVLNIPGVKDYTCGYRLYRYNIINKVIKKFGEEIVKEKSFACMMELLYKISKVDAKIDEVPFELRYDNKRGTSKMRVFTTMRRSITTSIMLQIKYNRKNVLKSCGIAIFLILFPLFLSLITNYSPTNNQPIMHDCGIFSYIAYAMQNGLVMYIDAWDNKGPLLYLLYYIGMSSAGEFGVYLLDYISLAITAIWGYKIIRLITNNRGLSIVGIIYALAAWVPTCEYGSFSEVFSLPFMTIGIYLFVKCIKNNISLPKNNIILLGFCSGALALLRLNTLLVFLPLFIIIGILLIKEKRAKEIGKWILHGLIGILIILIPVLIYLITNNALIECINTAYLQILSGFNSGTWADKLQAVKEMLITLNNSTQLSIFMLIFTVVGIVLLILRKIKNGNIKVLLIGSILTILINLYANGLSGAVQMHYFITFIPVIILMVALSLYAMKVSFKNKPLKILGVLLISAVMLISLKSYMSLANEIILRTEPKEYIIGYAIKNYIFENTEETDKVQMIGGTAESVTANYETKRFAATRYNYLPLWNSFKVERKAEIVNEVVDKIIEEKPKLIFICMQQYEEFNLLINDKEKWNEFLGTNYNVNRDEIKLYVVYNRK